MFTAIHKTRVEYYPTYKYLFYDQKVTTRIGTPKEAEYEIILRGRVLDPSKAIEFQFQEGETTEVQCNVVPIRGEFKESNEPNKITIEATDVEIGCIHYFPTVYFEEYQAASY